VCSITTVGKWFSKKAGMAMGVYSVLLSILFAIAFVTVGHVVTKYGWRAAWSGIAWALIFAITPLVVFALREPSDQKAQSITGETTNDFTLPQALHTGAFWLFAGAAASFNLVSSGLGLFNEAVLAERGFDQKTFHLFLAVSTLFSLIGQFACGWLATRTRYQSLTLGALVLYALGLAAISFVRSYWQLWAVAILLGISGGMIIVIFFSVWSDLFGQRHLGRIQGAAQMLTVISSALGPVLFARCFELNHSYAPVLFALAGAVLMLGLLARFIRSPRIRPIQ
jgi:cyanate permease